MAIEIHVGIQIVDSDSQSTLFKGEKKTCAYAADGTELLDCIDIAKAKMVTVVSEVEADVQEQIKDAMEGL